MRIRKDIVASFNSQIDKQLKDLEADIRRYKRQVGYGYTLRSLIDEKLKLEDMKRMFNNFSEAGVVVF